MNCNDFTLFYCICHSFMYVPVPGPVTTLFVVFPEYETCLEDEVEAAARADEARRAERREALLGGLRALKGARRATRADYDAQSTLKTDYVDVIKQLDSEIERAT